MSVHLCYNAAVSRCPAIRVDFGSRRISRDRIVVTLKPTGFRLAAVLLFAAPAFIHRDALIDYLWGDQSDGGPEWARNCIDAHLVAVRRGLPALGVEIHNHYGRGLSAEIENWQQLRVAA